MSLRLRLLLGFFLIVGLAGWAVLAIFAEEVKPGVRQGMEVALVDTAHLLAEVAGQDFAEPLPGSRGLEGGRLDSALVRYRKRDLGARVWGREHHQPGFRVYVTDERGIVRYDSTGLDLGADYSRWNDVARTLKGQYGVRSTRLDPKDPATSSMHVAAPILGEGGIRGVLTVVAPTASVQPYAQRSQRRVLVAGLALAGAALLIGTLLSEWFARSVGRLRQYARRVTEGQPAPMPRLGRGELGELAQALETMRNRLEDRQYVERYIQTLTHEMKSPLAAIRGAAELLREPLPEEDRDRFLTNVLDQQERLQVLIERMLGLARVQQRQELQDPSRLDLSSLVNRVLEALAPIGERRNLSLAVEFPPEAWVEGEVFLLEQAVRNLLDNAFAFSPDRGRVTVRLLREGPDWCLGIEDEGPGVPDWALDRVWEPFFSLAKPEGNKGSGIGLAFVQEVAQLHAGRAVLRNRPQGGCEASFRLPAC